MNDKGEVKIADFGMSKKLDNSGDLVESYVGTMLYMTPERLKGEKYTATTDLWSLGISIIEIATGINPYKKYTPSNNLLTFQRCQSIFEVIDELTTNKPPKMPKEYSEKFQNLISLMLKRNPKDRIGANELLEMPLMKKFEKKYDYCQGMFIKYIS